MRDYGILNLKNRKKKPIRIHKGIVNAKHWHKFIHLPCNCLSWLVEGTSEMCKKVSLDRKIETLGTAMENQSVG